MRPNALSPGITYAEVLRRGVSEDRVPQGYDIDSWVAERAAAHLNPPTPYLVERADDRWTLMTECRTGEGGIVGIRSGVTDLKRGEQNARRTERQTNKRLLRGLFNGLPTTIHTKNRDLRHDIVN